MSVRNVLAKWLQNPIAFEIESKIGSISAVGFCRSWSGVVF
jgi:hypothetical protein